MEGEKEMSAINDLDDDSLQELYSWIDEIPLSRPKRNIGRDFSDGGELKQLVRTFLPFVHCQALFSRFNSRFWMCKSCIQIL